jgi:hypothetical protein
MIPAPFRRLRSAVAGRYATSLPLGKPYSLHQVEVQPGGNVGGIAEGRSPEVDAPSCHAIPVMPLGMPDSASACSCRSRIYTPLCSRVRALARVGCPFRRRYPPIRFVRVGPPPHRSRKCHSRAPDRHSSLCGAGRHQGRAAVPPAGPSSTSTAEGRSCPGAEGSLLKKALPYRLVGQDAALDELLAVAFAARTQPALVETQHVGGRRERRALADIGEHVDEPHELS